MFVRSLTLLLLFGLPAIGLCQNPLRPENAEAKLSPAEELQRLVAERDSLTAKIDQLRKTAGVPQQVLVSVKVCEVSHSKARQLGLDLTQLQPFRLAKLVSADDNSHDVNLFEQEKQLNKIVAGLAMAGALKVIAAPTVATLSGQTAKFHAGGEFPILVAQGDGKTATQYRPYGTLLEVTPVVLGNGKIKLDLQPEVSELDPSLNVTTTDGGVVPGLRSRMIRTHIEMEAGQTFLLSGLVQQGKDLAGNGEPEQVELVVIVKAEIVDPLLR